MPDSTSCWVAWTTLLFRNSSTVLLFLCRVRTAQQCCQMCYFSAKFGYSFIWLAGEIRVWRVADFLAIFAIFWRKMWRSFVQDLDQCCFIKSCKNPLNIDERRRRRHEHAARNRENNSTYLCPTCGCTCLSRIGLYSHEQSHLQG